MQTEILKDIVTDEGEAVFQFRASQNEGVGILTTKTNKNYLILDSIDYWYDVIQDGYPKKKKCVCKNEWFSVQFTYEPRAGTDDIRGVDVITKCVSCGKTSNPLFIDLKYSPTKHLIDTPIQFCAAPKLKYDMKQFAGMWNRGDINAIFDYLYYELKMSIYCWFYNFAKEKFAFEKWDREKLKDASNGGDFSEVHNNIRFYNIFFSMKDLEMDRYIECINEKGAIIKENVWREAEILDISHIYFANELEYSIRYATQIIDKGVVKNKSAEFINAIEALKLWLEKTIGRKDPPWLASLKRRPQSIN
ncbi:MAG: hypothetical protein LBQ52_06240 [Helicobacteraceae bacterium]|jgi:hypothetical protein|nr:hypothetical protein [Helicobacteraceae bacterium]